MTQTIDGERALAWGAVEAGVGVVTGYPGSPGTNTFNAHGRNGQRPRTPRRMVYQ